MNKKVVIITLMCLVAASLVLAADKVPGVGKTYELTLSRDAVVGNVLLPAGDYRVQHLMEGEKHVMLFSGPNGKQARVECAMLKLDHKATIDTAEYSTGPKGERVLSSLVFKGEAYQHKF